MLCLLSNIYNRSCSAVELCFCVHVWRPQIHWTFEQTNEILNQSIILSPGFAPEYNLSNEWKKKNSNHNNQLELCDRSRLSCERSVILMTIINNRSPVWSMYYTYMCRCYCARKMWLKTTNWILCKPFKRPTEWHVPSIIIFTVI